MNEWMNEMIEQTNERTSKLHVNEWIIEQTNELVNE